MSSTRSFIEDLSVQWGRWSTTEEGLYVFDGREDLDALTIEQLLLRPDAWQAAGKTRLWASTILESSLARIHRPPRRRQDYRRGISSYQPEGMKKPHIFILICEDEELGKALAKEHLSDDKITYVNMVPAELRTEVVDAIDNITDV